MEDDRKLESEGPQGDGQGGEQPGRVAGEGEEGNASIESAAGEVIERAEAQPIFYDDTHLEEEGMEGDAVAIPSAAELYSSETEAEGERARWFELPRRWEFSIYGALLAIAGVMRLWDLGIRALHHDESLHAVYSWYLYVGRGYQHLPLMHGPFQFHANSFTFFLFGDSDYSSRLLYAIFGTVLVVLPFFLRKRLGQVGALLVATLLAFSPTMLYFSRFARNDILMAVWTLGLVIAMWRYMDERKNRYLYLSAGLLALMFSTKETAFIVVAVSGSFLLSMAGPEFLHWLRGRKKLSELSPAGTLLLLFATLTLPQWSAAVSIFENLFGVVLANPDSSAGPVGAPLGGGMVIAQVAVAGTLAVSIAMGVKWSRSVWLWCAAIFYSIWLLLYTTFFTNILGVATGMWQSLGYWIVQQDVQRGGQPWYYYFVIGSVYEFLPIVFALAASVYYMRRRDLFGSFLVYWSVLTFFLYTMAGEKMPWLLVNVSLPLILLAGRFLGELIQKIQWRSLLERGGIWLAPAVGIFAIFFWRLLFFEIDSRDPSTIYLFAIVVAVLLVVVAGVGYVARRAGTGNAVAFCALSFAVILFALTIRSGWLASYENGDVPVEMLVYTQTSPDIPRVAREIDAAGDFTGQGTDLKVTVDSTDGYTWPWAWYLRYYDGVSYPCYSGDPGCISLQKTPDSSVVLVNARNNNSAEPYLDDTYSEGVRIKHRWWFPESYRGVTWDKFVDGVTDRSQWRRAADYFLHRKLGTELGSIDAYVYFSRNVPPSEAMTQ